ADNVDVHAFAQRGVGRRGNDVVLAQRGAAQLEDVADGAGRQLHAALLAAVVKGEVLGRGDVQVHALSRDLGVHTGREGAGGDLVVLADLAQHLLDGDGGGVDVLALAVNDEGNLLGGAHLDGVVIGDGLGRSRADQVLGVDLDAVLLQDVANVAGDGAGLDDFAVDVQRDVLVRRSSDATADNQGRQHAAGGQTQWRGVGVVNAVQAGLLLRRHSKPLVIPVIAPAPGGAELLSQYDNDEIKSRRIPRRGQNHPQVGNTHCNSNNSSSHVQRQPACAPGRKVLDAPAIPPPGRTER